MLSILKSGEQSIEGFLFSLFYSTSNVSSSSEEPPSNASSEERFSLSDSPPIRLFMPNMSSSKLTFSFCLFILVDGCKI